MSQAFNVRLKSLGPNRLSVLVLIRHRTGLRADECRRLADKGDLVVAKDVSRDEAMSLAARLERSGACVKIEVSIDD